MLIILKNIIKITLIIFLVLRSNVEAENVNIEESSKHNKDEIIVRDRASSSIEKSGTTTVINHDDVAAHSDKSLDDSLKNVPGLQVSMHKKGYIRAQFRGFDQNRIAILLDGIPLTDVYSTDIDISEIPVSDISEIIVNRGAASSLYGSMGGVGIINIITRKPHTPYYEVKAEYGQYNNIYLSASLGAPVGNFFFRITGEYNHSGGYEISKKLDRKKKREWFDRLVRYDLYGLDFEDVNLPAKNDYINDIGFWDHNEFTRYGFSTKMGYNLESGSEAGILADYNFKKALSNSYQHNCISNYKDSDVTWSDPVFDVTPDPMEIKNAAFRNRSFVWPQIHNMSVSPYISLLFNRLIVKGNLFLSYKQAIQEKYASTDHEWPGDTVLADTALEPFKTIKEYMSWGANFTPSIRLAEWNNLGFAFLYRYNIYNESEQAISSEKSPTIAATIFGLDPYPVKRLDVSYFTAAVEDEIHIGGRLVMSAGVSYDSQFFNTFKNREALYQYEDAYIVKNDSGLLGTKDSINPVAGISFIPVKNLLLLRAAYSIKTRFPDLSEYSMIVDDKRDNGLKPERSYNLNTGFEVYFFERTVTFRTDYFISKIENRIEKISGGMDPPINIGEIRSQGIESIFTLEMKKFADIVDIKFKFSYTYLHARSLDDTHEEKVNKGKFLEFTPEHQLTADLRLKFISGTSIDIWGYSTINQVVYAMKERPDPFPANTAFSTEYFEAVKLHNPVMLNIKCSQKVLTHYELYIMCKNVLDDYNADPFIPGPGRMFYAGGSLEF